MRYSTFDSANKKAGMRISVILGMVLAVQCLYGQQSEQERLEEYRRNQAQLEHSSVMRQFDSAVYLVDQTRYLQADIKFRYVLENLPSLPSEFAYQFGRNSYYLKKYKQSIDWLNKYIELKGTLGQHYSDAVSLLKMAESDFLERQKHDASQAEAILSSDYDVDCGPTGFVMCPVCKGSHVIIKPGLFGMEYNTCPYCNEHGLLTCEEYNLLIRGKLKPRTN